MNVFSGKTFKAHRLILAACSKHFQELFQGMPLMPPNGLIVILDGTSSDQLGALLEFMYHGEVNIPEPCIPSFIKAGEYLQVKGLSMDQATLDVFGKTVAERLGTTADSATNLSGSSSSETVNGAQQSSAAGATAASANNNVLTNGNACSASSTSSSGSTCANEAGGVENGLARSLKRRTPTPARTSPVQPNSVYVLNHIYNNSQYYDSPQKRLLR